jgi:formylglycine-generating enzyme required for sulfatase activity
MDKSIKTVIIIVNLLSILSCQILSLSKKNESYVAPPEHHLTPPKLVSEKDPELMVLIPAGTFTMGNETGNEDEQPAHEVYVDAFYIDVAEVSCARYENFLKDTDHPPHQMWNPEYDRPDDPVVGVSWYDASAFAKWAEKRLPTEAEWEKAARGGLVGKNYPWGDEINREKANYQSFGITPVKNYEPNSYGLYDIAGNVWEWCLDWYSKEYYNMSTKKNPKGPMLGSKKVVKGGAWYCGEAALQVSNRHKIDPQLGSFHIGFRCVKSVKDIGLRD